MEWLMNDNYVGWYCEEEEMNCLNPSASMNEVVLNENDYFLQLVNMYYRMHTIPYWFDLYEE